MIERYLLKNRLRGLAPTQKIIAHEVDGVAAYSVPNYARGGAAIQQTIAALPVLVKADVPETILKAGMYIKWSHAKALKRAGYNVLFDDPQHVEIEAGEVQKLDRAYRGAWRFDKASGIKVSMAAAKQIHMGRIREARNEAFKPVDDDFAKYHGRAQYGDDLSTKDEDFRKAREAEAKRQQLRDTPQSVAAEIAAAKTVAELKAVWPAVLR